MQRRLEKRKSYNHDDKKILKKNIIKIRGDKNE